MATTITTHQSYFSRLGDSLKGMLGGLIFFFGAIILLFWNEGRAVKRSNALKEGAAASISIDAKTIDSANDGKLVHFSGFTDLHDTLSDPLLEEEIQALSLKRIVETYQWEEDSETTEKINTGGSSDTVTTYTYKKVWSNRLIDSSEFKESGHDNPASSVLPSAEYTSKGVTVGAFLIPDERVEFLGRDTTLEIPLSTNALPAGSPNGLIRVQNGFYLSQKGSAEIPATPEIGDVRISFKKADPCNVSFVARQNGNSIEPYITKNGGKIFLQTNGIKTKDEMFTTAQKSNKFMTNLLRLIGFIIMVSGLRSFLNPLKVLSDVLPFLGKIFNVGLGLIAGVVSLAVSLVTIAVAWIFYRPVLTVALLVIAGALIFFIWKKTKAKATPAA